MAPDATAGRIRPAAVWSRSGENPRGLSYQWSPGANCAVAGVAMAVQRTAATMARVHLMQLSTPTARKGRTRLAPACRSRSDRPPGARLQSSSKVAPSEGRSRTGLEIALERHGSVLVAESDCYDQLPGSPVGSVRTAARVVGVQPHVHVGGEARVVSAGIAHALKDVDGGQEAHPERASKTQAAGNGQTPSGLGQSGWQASQPFTGQQRSDSAWPAAGVVSRRRRQSKGCLVDNLRVKVGLPTEAPRGRTDWACQP